MSKVLIEESSLQNIANAIRAKNKGTDKYKPSEMATAIDNIQTLNGGGYKVNITQSEHQTITVSQPSFDNQTSGFTIDDYPSINVSLKADPGYIAGSLNRTNFTFSNDVREVDIFATAASYSPNITYNGNMNVFLSTYLSTNTKIFNITTGTKKDNVSMGEYAANEAFALTLANNGDVSFERLVVHYKNNFYNLDPNCKYKITTLKIGDTSLLADDISDGDPNISSTSYTFINADMNKNWVKSVYKQCTGKELIEEDVGGSSSSYLKAMKSAENMDAVLQSDETPLGTYIGQQIADRLYKSETVSSTIVNTYINKYDTPEFFKTLSKDKQTEFTNSVEFFMTSYETNTTGLRDGNLIQNYFNILKQFQDKYANDATATSVLEKYDPIKNIDFTNLSSSIDIFKIVYNIDPSNTYGFTSSLNGGLAYVLWVFYAYYVLIIAIISGLTFTPADPIISTIPVSITFTNTAQQ